MDEQSNKIKVGSIADRLWHLSLQVTFASDNDWFLDILAFDPSDMRKAGVLARLTEHHYQSFKELIQKTDKAITEIKDSRKQNQQKVMEQLRSLPNEQLSLLGINPEWLN